MNSDLQNTLTNQIERINEEIDAILENNGSIWTKSCADLEGKAKRYAAINTEKLEAAQRKLSDFSEAEYQEALLNAGQTLHENGLKYLDLRLTFEFWEMLIDSAQFLRDCAEPTEAETQEFADFEAEAARQSRALAGFH